MKSETSSELASLSTGDAVQGTYLVQRLQLRTGGDKKQFVLGELQDQTGQLGMVKWHVSDGEWQRLGKAKTVKVSGQVKEHRGGLQIVVKVIEPTRDDPNAFVPGLSSAQREELWQSVLELIDSIEDAWCARLVKSVLLEDQQVKTAFQQAPAGVSMHHAQLGGLLRHTVGVARLARAMAAQYPPEVCNASVVVAGALVHDIGKIRELVWESGFQYSDAGRLLGHVADGASHVDAAVAAIDGFPADQRLALLHLVLSHHGQPEFGAAREPATVEALILHQADYLDAGVDAVLATPVGEDGWTEAVRFFGGRRFLRQPGGGSSTG